ncbi:hypothetical protein J4G37_16455 [Microvirga sp. 3-52]|nr:hypothetical protein [Microvirga sp. 3-52]
MDPLFVRGLSPSSVGNDLSCPTPAFVLHRPWSCTCLGPAPALATPTAVMAGLDPAIPM